MPPAAFSYRLRPVSRALGLGSAALGGGAWVAAAAGGASAAVAGPFGMHDATAWGLLAGGGAVAAWSFDRRLLGAAAGVAVAALGATVLLVQILGKPGGPEPLSTPLNSAVALTLAGAAVLAQGRFRFATALLGSLVGILGLVALVGHAIDLPRAFAWDGVHPMSLAASLGLAFLGGGLVTAAVERQGREGERAAAWLPFLIGATAAITGLLLWQALRVHEADRIRATVRATAHGAAGEIEARLGSAVRALELLAEHGRAVGWRSREDWRSDARLTIGAFPGFEVMEWIDGRFRPRVVASRGPEPRPLAGSFVAATRLELANRQARLSRGPVVVGPFAFTDDAPALRIIVPILAVERPEAYLSAVFAAEDTLGGLSRHIAPSHWLEVRCDGRVVFRHGEAAAPSTGRWAQQLDLRLPGPVPWTLAVAPGNALGFRPLGLPEVILFASLLIALLLTLTFRFGEIASLRARHFEGAVRQRTEELETAKAVAEHANAAKDRFFAMLGHELRNPLGSMRNALEVLDRGQTDAPSAPRMQGIFRRQLHHLGRLVDDLLDVSGIERGKVAMRPERLDLVPLVREVVDHERRRIEDAELTVEVTLPETSVWVDADPTRLAQIIGNLLSNAIKFTAAGGGIWVSLMVEEEPGEAVVSVRDNGCGLTREELSEVFEPFVQGSAPPNAGGLGLGLPIIKGLVEASAGAVEARSDGRGQGAEFRIRLPLRPPVEGSPPAAPPATPAAEGRKVLVIDDHRDSATGLAELLELLGHRSVVANDGETGLEEARRWRPDVVVSDLALPGIHGCDVARALRDDPAIGDLRLIALTGFGDDETSAKARAAGFDHHLTKPVDPQELERLVALPPPGQSRGWAGSPATTSTATSSRGAPRSANHATSSKTGSS